MSSTKQFVVFLSTLWIAYSITLLPLWYLWEMFNRFIGRRKWSTWLFLWVGFPQCSRFGITQQHFIFF